MPPIGDQMSNQSDFGLRTLLVGLDAATSDILDEVASTGVIPTIQRLRHEGLAGPLESQLPPWTASAWPSMYTGVNPGKHGVFDFLSFDGYDWDVVNRTNVREHALWELLDRAGVSSVVVNVPVTHPPKPFDGALVPGYVAPESPPGHPKDILEDIRSAIGAYQLYNPAPRQAPTEERVEGFVTLSEMRGSAFRYLANRFEPDFGFLQFQQTDTVYHEFPEDDQAIQAVWGAVDRELCEIIDQCQPDTIILASDHGIAEYPGVEFRINEYLRRQGFLETTTDGEGMPSWSSIARNRLRGTEETGSRLSMESFISRGISMAATVGITSQRVERILDRFGLTSFVASIVPTDAIRAASEQVDFPASTAYMRSRVEMGVRINLAGREPNGVVPPDQYESVRASVSEALKSVRTPDGDRVFESVRPREAVFEGPYVDEAADVIAVPSNYNHRLTTSMLGDEFGPIEGGWEHVPEGMVALSGVGVDGTASLDGAHLLDLTPTILAMFGMPAGERMDGSVLEPVEGCGTTAYAPFERGAEESTDDADVERRLAQLGYLE